MLQNMCSEIYIAAAREAKNSTSTFKREGKIKICAREFEYPYDIRANDKTIILL